MPPDVRKTYIPYMCDHALALEAALQALGVPAETLPPPDEETLAMGRELCLGRECLPLFVAAGDILRRARQPDFNPAHATYFMPTTCGPCRFGGERKPDIIDTQDEYNKSKQETMPVSAQEKPPVTNLLRRRACCTAGLDSRRLPPLLRCALRLSLGWRSLP